MEENLTHKNCLAIYKNSNPTIIDCIKGKSIAVLKAEHSEKEITMFLRMVIADLATYFNIGSTMTPENIKETVDVIYAEYYHLSIEAFKLCFSKAKAGKFGKVLGLDGSIICGWLNQLSHKMHLTVAINNRIRKPEGGTSKQMKEFYSKFKKGPVKESKFDQVKLKQIQHQYDKDPKAYLKTLTTKQK